MIRTRFCELLGIDVPIIQASLGPWGSAELAAAVSNAGGLGTVAAVLRSPEELQRMIARTRELTDRPFAVNHSFRPFNEEAFRVTLQAKPAAISLAHADPGDLVTRAHAVGCRVIHMVNTVQQAHQAAERGVDVIIAQGTESGGFGGLISTLALVPQVVDAVRPIPVIAAGGIADGRGLAAALVLGAEGVNIGTRFLASREAAVDGRWKESIVSAESEHTVRAEFMSSILPPAPPGGYEAAPRVLRTAFVDEWNRRRSDAEREAESLRARVMKAFAEGRAHELIPFTGQSAGMIREILPVAEILRRMVSEAEAILKKAPGLVT